MGETGVVQRTVLLRNDHGFTPHLHDKGLRDRQKGGRRGDGEGSSHEPGNVDAGAREGHGRMDCQRDRSRVGGGTEQSDPGGARQVDDDMPALPHAQIGQPLSEGPNLIVGNGEYHHLRAPRHLLRRRDRYAGQHGVGALARGGRGG